MKRLLDESVTLDTGEQRLAELFAVAACATPDPFRKRRIRARLGAIELGRVRQAKLFGLKGVLIGAALACATTAAAMVTHEMGIWGGHPPQGVAVAPLSHEVPGAAFRETRRAVEPDQVANQDPSPPPAPGAEGRSMSARTPAVSAEDPTLVAKAILALRNQHNPAQARLLLNRYLTTNPRGALVEDALALSIEAADAMKDPQAATLGCRYVALYPNGRHRYLASRACAKSAK